MKYTIKSIAEELNLSRNTVAKVLSGKDGVSQKTTKLVLEKIKELEQTAPEVSQKQTAVESAKIHPTAASQGDIILLLMPEFSRNTDFCSRLILTLEKELSQRGYRLLTGTWQTPDETDSGIPEHVLIENAALALPDLAARSEIKGLITVEIKDNTFCEQLTGLPIPVSMIDLAGNCLSYKGLLDLVTLDTTVTFRQAASLFQSDSIQNFTVQAPVEQLGIAAVRCVTDRILEPQMPHVYQEFIPTLIFHTT